MLTGIKDLSLLQNVRIASGILPGSYLMGNEFLSPGWNLRCFKLTAHLRLVSRKSMKESLYISLTSLNLWGGQGRSYLWIYRKFLYWKSKVIWNIWVYRDRIWRFCILTHGVMYMYQATWRRTPEYSNLHSCMSFLVVFVSVSATAGRKFRSARERCCFRENVGKFSETPKPENT